MHRKVTGANTRRLSLMRLRRGGSATALQEQLSVVELGVRVMSVSVYATATRLLSCMVSWYTPSKTAGGVSVRRGVPVVSLCASTLLAYVAMRMPALSELSHGRRSPLRLYCRRTRAKRSAVSVRERESVAAAISYRGQMGSSRYDESNGLHR